MAWKPPADAIEWKPPADTVEAPKATAPATPRNLMAASPEPEEGYDGSWEEAVFPRATDAKPGSFAAKLAGDVMSLPFRAMATVPAAIGAGDETIGESMHRTGGREDEPGWMQFLDNVIRHPVNAVLPGATKAGGALFKAFGKPAGLLASTALRTAPASLAIAGGNQAQNVAEGKPISLSQAAIDAALSEALGLGTASVAAGASKMAPGLRNLAAAMLTKSVNPTDKARLAGWNPTHVLEDLSKAGKLPWKMGSYRKNFQGLIDEAAQGQEQGVAADIAAGQASGRPVVVDLNRAAQSGQSELDAALQRRKLAGAEGFVPGAQTWLSKSTHTTGLAPRDVSLVDLDAALQTRRNMDKFAFVDNAKGMSAARKIGARGTRGNINEQLDVVAPRTREADARLARLLPNIEGMGAVMDRRLNNHFFNPADIIAGLIAGEHGGPAAGLGVAAISRLLRTTVPTTAAWKLAQLADISPEIAKALTPELLRARAAATDNARGTR